MSPHSVDIGLGAPGTTAGPLSGAYAAHRGADGAVTLQLTMCLPALYGGPGGTNSPQPVGEPAQPSCDGSEASSGAFDATAFTVGMDAAERCPCDPAHFKACCVEAAVRAAIAATHRPAQTPGEPMTTTVGPRHYRKKPVEIRALQWTGDNATAVAAFTRGQFDVFSTLDRANCDDPDATAHVFDALHSTWMLAQTGDHIIEGVQGEFYPIRDEVFRATYEPVDGPHTAHEPGV